MRFSIAVMERALLCQSTVPSASMSYTTTWYLSLLLSSLSMQLVAFKMSLSLPIAIRIPEMLVVSEECS